MLSSSLPAQIPFVPGPITLLLCPHFSLHFYLFLSLFSSPSRLSLREQTLGSNPASQTAAHHRLSEKAAPALSLSLLFLCLLLFLLPCLPPLCLSWLIWVYRLGTARCSPSPMSDCDTNYLYLIGNGSHLVSTNASVLHMKRRILLQSKLSSRREKICDLT